MCDPVTITFAAVAAAGAGGGQALSIRQQHKAAKAQSKAVQEAGHLDYQSLLRQYQESNEDAARQGLQRQIQTERYRGRLRATQADYGVAGQSPMQLLNQALMAEQYDLGVVDSNRQSSLLQTKDAMAATQSRMAGQLNQARGMTMGKFGQALAIGSSALTGAQAGYSLGQGVSDVRPKKIGDST